MTALPVLVLTALSVATEVFPTPLCQKLPEVSAEVNAWAARAAPELARARIRELDEKTALAVFGRAAAAGWGGIDVLTDAVFREPCTFYLSREALHALDTTFDLNLPTALRGRDTDGRDFKMAAILAGRGKLVVFYDRDGIVYRNERLKRDFMLASRVEFDTPLPGVLQNIHGLCAKVLRFGCVRVASMMKHGDTVEVRAGSFSSKSPLKPIRARGESDG
jgi:hypothetical protein